MPVTSWSLTAADNNAAPPNGWPEGMAPSAVNNTARQGMADIVREFQVNAVKVLASVAGTNTITGSMTPDLASYSAGMLVVLTPANNNTGAATLNIDSLGALDILKADGDALVSGDLVAGVPACLVLDSGADDFYLMNPQTLNGTAVTVTNAVTGGSLSISGAATINGALTTDNTTADEVGFKGLPQNGQDANYTLTLSDASKHLYAGLGGPYTWTIPANASVPYPVGSVLTFVNESSSSVTIAITSDTLVLSGTAATGSRTLTASTGVATALKVNTTRWVISGTGLS